MRSKKKLLGKSNWFKERKKSEEYITDSRKTGKKRVKKKVPDTKMVEQKTVLFVEQTRKGELAANLRNLLSRLAPTLKFGVKVVERTGTALKSRFSQGSLWEGIRCGRGEKECVTCYQDCETLPPCTRVSVMYENICAVCNPEARGKKEVKKIQEDPPSVYVGETSRSLQERSQEHHADLRNGRDKSHMLKHRMLHHDNKDTPFIMRAISFHRSALSRQAAEAVRIRRRGEKEPSSTLVESLIGVLYRG